MKLTLVRNLIDPKFGDVIFIEEHDTRKSMTIRAIDAP
jgi:hypothetical protein